MTSKSKKQVTWTAVSLGLAVVIGSVTLGIFPRCDEIITRTEMREAIAQESTLLQKDCNLTNRELRRIRDDISELRADIKQILQGIK